MSKRKTNEQFVKDLMMFSRRGALIQPFVIQALQVSSEMVVKQHASGELAKQMGGNFFINAEAWADCAKEVLEKLSTQYGTNKPSNQPE